MKSSKFRDLLMFMEQSTATCFVLSVELEKLAVTKILPRRFEMCGIFITEGDSLLTLICRRCEGRTSKASEFRQTSQILQIQLLQQKYSVNLSCKPPSVKRSTSELRHATTQPRSQGLPQKALQSSSTSGSLQAR